MDDLIRSLTKLVASPLARQIGKAVAILAIGFLLARVLPPRLPIRRLDSQHQLVVRRLVRYALVIGAVIGCLHVLGVSPSVLLGTAGLLTVALGFAAQTSASNLISGLFLLAEQPFVLGDTIESGGLEGEVVSMSLLAVRLRTVDNLLVRIPNESILKAAVTNRTHFPIRRLDMRIRIAYQEDPRKVRELLLRIAQANPICLEEPQPRVVFVDFRESSVELELRAWATRKNFVQLGTALREEVHQEFRAQGIEMPTAQHVFERAPG